MYKAISALFIVVSLALISVLWLDSKHSHSIAIINLDKVATEIGRTEIISNKVNDFVSTQKKKLNERKNELEAKIADLKDQIGQAPTQKQSQQLLSMTRQAEIEIKRRVALIQQQAEQLKVKLVLEFKNELTPIIRNVAQQRQFDVVEVMSPTHIYIHPRIDISDDVINMALNLNGVNSDEKKESSPQLSGEKKASSP